MFTLNAGETQTYGTQHLPFGWSWSSIIAQLTLARILAPVVQWFPGSLWQYFDDILISDEERHLLYFARSYISHILSLSGLHVNSTTQLQPATELTWLGKRNIRSLDVVNVLLNVLSFNTSSYAPLSIQSHSQLDLG